MTLDLPVKFRGVSFGTSTARIGVAISRDLMSLEKADESLCERRLIGRIVRGHAEDAPGQTTLVDCDHVVEGAFDVKQFAAKKKDFSAGLTFSVEEIDRGELAEFANASGRLMIDDILAEIPKAEKEDEDDDSPSLFVADEDAEWREIELTTLFGGQKVILAAFEAESLRTIGDFVDWQSKDYNHTSSLKGCGPVKVQLIEDTFQKFWEDNPDLSRE